MEKLKGPFKDIIPVFQNYKKSLGYLYDNISAFYELDNILFENNIKNLNDTKLIFDIAIVNETKISKKKVRYYCLKELYEFMKILNYNNLYFKELKFRKEYSITPRILNIKEIKVFINLVDVKSTLLKGKEKYIYPVLFRLLYSSGLRINETLSLKIADISIKQGIINIKKGKNNIARMIPISTSMQIILLDYLKINKSKIYLFEINNKPIPYKKVQSFFRAITENLFKFRIHDLRHTFAVHVFNKLNKKGYSLHQILYYLHIYMGHTNIESTEYYLRMTNQSYRIVLNQTKKHYPTIIPKVGDINE